MLNAIHVHPHDIRDEGAEQVLEAITRLGKVNTVIAETVALEERHPYPSGILPHNPLRPVVISRATLEVPLPENVFQGLPFGLLPSPEVRAGNDYLADLRKAAASRGVSVIPWLKGLNGAFEGDLAEYCVRTLDQEAVPTWLCPAHPEAIEYVFALMKGVLAAYPSEAVLLDRMRYPDWSGATVKPERMLTCFCATCRQLMREDGIRLALLEKGLTRLLDDARHDPESLLTLGARGPEMTEVQKWLSFRCKLITHAVSQIKAKMTAFNRKQGTATRFWLNLWPPSFAGYLGQDYRALGRLCEGAKHFPYHRLGGGADLKGLLEAVCGPEPRDDREKLFRALRALLNLPYPLDFEEFKTGGFPVEFVARETALAKAAFGGTTPVYSGIQIWDTPLAEIVKACEAAQGGQADGYFFYCFGWAGLQALETVGQYLTASR